MTGSQGDFLRGAITSNADLETGARNDLKNRAAAMGGNVVYLLTQRAGQTGRKDHSEQTNVTLTGNVPLRVSGLPGVRPVRRRPGRPWRRTDR